MHLRTASSNNFLICGLRGEQVGYPVVCLIVLNVNIHRMMHKQMFTNTLVTLRVNFTYTTFGFCFF